MSIQSTAHHLLRRWRSVPIPNLSQGSSLTIRSTVAAAPTNVIIQPEWRDNGHVELKQVFSKKTKSQEKEALVQMRISQEEDLKTSLGRVERHISVVLSDDRGGQHHHHHHEFYRTTATKPPLKHIDKVILDDGTIHPDAAEYAPPPPGMRRVEYHDGFAHITKDNSSMQQQQQQQPRLPKQQHDDKKDEQEERPGTYLKVQVPEKVNLICDLQSGAGGSIVICGKVEGDVTLSTTNGDIKVSKLRGHKIVLQQQQLSGTEKDQYAIYCKDLLEAQSLTIHTTGRFRAKQVHGKSVTISVNKEGQQHPNHHAKLQDDDDEGSLVDVSALFVSAGGGGASIQVLGGGGGGRGRVPLYKLTRRAVRIKSHHGPLKVVTKALTMPTDIDQYTGRTYPVVELGGVNGNCEVAIHDITVHDEDAPRAEEWTSCAVHFDSLLPDSVSLITIDRGNVLLTLDRKVESDLRLLSTSNDECLIETGALLAEEEDPELLLQVIRHLPQGPAKYQGQQRLSIEANAFTARSSHTVESEDADVAYVEGWVENKSPEPDSRFDRRLRGEGKIRLESAAAQAFQSFSKKQTEDDEQTHESSEKLRPLVAVVSTGRITVEPVSWIGAIARRYGMNEGNRGIGRTASKRGRSIVPRNE